MDKRTKLARAIYSELRNSKLPTEAVISILETIKLDIILNKKLIRLDGRVGSE